MSDKAMELLSKQHGVRAINLKQFPIDPKVLALVPAGIVRERRALPVEVAGEALVIAMSDPSDTVALEAIRRHTGRAVEVVVATEAGLDDAIARYYDRS